MIRTKTVDEIKTLQEGGAILARIVGELGAMLEPGLPIHEIDMRASTLMKDAGVASSFLNYTPEGASHPYPSHVCVSINEEIVHGLPVEDRRIIQIGDVVTIDAGIKYKGLITDHAHTFAIGKVDTDVERLLDATQEALQAGIDVAQPGNTTGDIGNAIERVAEKFHVAVFRELVGHGVGYAVHEEPYFPNYGVSGEGTELVEGLVIAIEPMFGLGSEHIKLASDGYTYTTNDKSYAAHFEHTVAITSSGNIVLTADND